MRIQLNQNLPHVRTSITNNIGHRLLGLSTAKILATEMLPRSVEFILALNDFISDTYKEVLAASPSCDKEGSWDLVTFITQQLFRDEFQPIRIVTKSGIDPHNPQSTAKQIIWGSLRTMQLVETFLKV